MIEIIGPATYSILRCKKSDTTLLLLGDIHTEIRNSANLVCPSPSGQGPSLRLNVGQLVDELRSSPDAPSVVFWTEGHNMKDFNFYGDQEQYMDLYLKRLHGISADPRMRPSMRRSKGYVEKVLYVDMRDEHKVSEYDTVCSRKGLRSDFSASRTLTGLVSDIFDLVDRFADRIIENHSRKERPENIIGVQDEISQLRLNYDQSVRKRLPDIFKNIFFPLLDQNNLTSLYDVFGSIEGHDEHGDDGESKRERSKLEKIWRTLIAEIVGRKSQLVVEVQQCIEKLTLCVASESIKFHEKWRKEFEDGLQNAAVFNYLFSGTRVWLKLWSCMLDFYASSSLVLPIPKDQGKKKLVVGFLGALHVQHIRNILVGEWYDVVAENLQYDIYKNAMRCVSFNHHLFPFLEVDEEPFAILPCRLCGKRKRAKLTSMVVPKVSAKYGRGDPH